MFPSCPFLWPCFRNALTKDFLLHAPYSFEAEKLANSYISCSIKFLSKAGIRKTYYAQYMMEGYFISLNIIPNVFRTTALNRVTMKETCTLRQSGQCPGCNCCIISVVFLEKRTKIISKRTSMIRGFHDHKTILYLLCCNIITQYGSTVYIGIAMLYPH